MQTNGSAAAEPAPAAPERKLKRSMIMLQGRVPLAAAEDGMFPAPFAKVGMRWWQTRQVERVITKSTERPLVAAGDGDDR